MIVKNESGIAFPLIHKRRVELLQFNLGRLCNQACRHCHIDASPTRSSPAENASPQLVDDVLELLQRDPGIATLDLTGGAPEQNPGFRRLVRGARQLGRAVFVRHNLTVQYEPEQEDLPEFFAEEGVVAFCSLPCYLEKNVDRQRGNGVFERSISALRRLNAVGYGEPESGLDLNLVYNPAGPILPPRQDALEADYRRELDSRFGIRFSRLFSITNQPIQRFRRDLERHGQLDDYLRLLQDNYNERTVPEVMCRSAISLRWDGRLFDCDFNLALDLPLRGEDGKALTLRDLLEAESGSGFLEHHPIVVGSHCFACTAGCGSSCGGSLA